jgi:hypothetical protein
MNKENAGKSSKKKHLLYIEVEFKKQQKKTFIIA